MSKIGSGSLENGKKVKAGPTATSAATWQLSQRRVSGQRHVARADWPVNAQSARPVSGCAWPAVPRRRGDWWRVEALPVVGGGRAGGDWIV